MRRSGHEAVGGCCSSRGGRGGETKDSKTALDWARKNGHTSVVALLEPGGGEKGGGGEGGGGEGGGGESGACSHDQRARERRS